MMQREISIKLASCHPHSNHQVLGAAEAFPMPWCCPAVRAGGTSAVLHPLASFVQCSACSLPWAAKSLGLTPQVKGIPHWGE